VAHALDLLTGRAPLYIQQPNMFYFPGLPPRPFFEREEFDWLEGIEAAVPAIRSELEALIADEANFPPMVVQTGEAPPPANPLLNDPSWGAYHIWRRGRLIEENAARVPATMAALDLAPIPMIANSSPMVMFSLLRPQTRIVAHHGISNTRLICHVPLIAPEGCGLRVAHEVRHWEEGRALIFDDSFEHEAWNRGSRTRVVLLFEIWRPEISAPEREELTALFEAIELPPDAATDL
jgi:aspartyl/asparaginyl beta-hydroxylase (cupin superfamily)